MSRISDFRLGVTTLKEGFTFFWRRPRLWIYAVIPFFLAMIVFATFFGLFLDHFGNLFHWVFGFLGSMDIKEPTDIWMKTADGLFWILNQLLRLFLFLLGLVLLSLATYVFQMILAGPFNDRLSEKVEGLQGTPMISDFSWIGFPRNLLRVFVTELIKTAFFLFMPIFLLLLNLLPLLGSLLYSILLLFFGLWDVGFSCVDYPMARKQTPFWQRVRFALKHKYSLMGLGIPFFFPFAPLFLQAPMVVGGTLLYCKIKNDTSTLPISQPPPHSGV